MADTEIEWATKVWNVTRGCRRISPGCGGPHNQGGCYAERQAIRMGGPGGAYEGLVQMTANGPRWTGKGLFAVDKLDEPLRWRAPRDGSRHRIFVNSMSDLFFEAFSNEEIAAVFGVMGAALHHDFIVLTKRPERMAEWFAWVAAYPTGLKSRPTSAALTCSSEAQRRVGWKWSTLSDTWPLPNVWIGVSAEDQPRWDERKRFIHDCPAAVKLASFEPLLGPIVMGATGRLHLDWAIIGSENGPRWRPMQDDWARSLRDECADGDVRLFLKQMRDADRRMVSLPMLDGRQWAEMPEARK